MGSAANWIVGTWPRSLRVLAAGLALGTAALLPSGPASGRTQDAAAPTAEAPRDHALLVACTYARRPARQGLKGCVNDAELLAERFHTVLGIPEERIELLVEGGPGTQPTHANILAALDGLTAAARRGDRVLLFFAGHGTLQPDGPDADEVDGLDEVFLPADAGEARRRGRRTVIENALVDDELFVAVRALLAKGVRVCLFSDSCHSATLGRGDDDRRSRGLDPEELGLELHRDLSRGGRVPSRPGEALDPGASFVGLFAVQADEEAQERRIDVGGGEERIHGVFSWSLAQALTRTGGEATFDDVLRLVVAGYRELGFHEITPFLQGDRSSSLGGGGEVTTSRFAERVGDAVEVDGGVLHGLLAGSRLALLAEDGTTPLAELRVLAATAVRARCELVPGPEPAADPWPAGTSRLPVRLLESPAGGAALPVHVAGEGAPPWRDELHALDPGGARVRLTDGADAAAWTLEADGDDWLLRPTDEPARRRYRLASTNVARTLLDLQRVATLLRLPARTAPLPEGLQVEVLHEDRVLVDGERVAPGSVVTLRAYNGTKLPVDLWVFWVDADQGVTRVFPDPDLADASPFLVPAGKARAQAFDVRPQEVVRLVTDGTQGTEHFLILAVPPGTADLGFLATDALVVDSRGDEDAGGVFDELAFGPREGADYTQGIGAGTFAEVLSLRMTWEPARSPARLEGRELVLPAREPDGSFVVPPGLAPPPAWDERVHLVESGRMRLVADRSERPTHIAIDLAGPSLVSDAMLGASIRDGSFGADLALAFDPETGRRTAWYDRRSLDDVPFDLVRVDEDGDGLADLEHRLEGGTWITRRDPAAPWLRLAELDFHDLSPRDPLAVEDAALALLADLLNSD